MHCKSVYPKLHSHGRLLAVRFCILPFFFLKSRQKERNKSNWERKKAKCRLLSQLIVASVNAALWDHDMVSYKYKFLSRQSAVILRLSSALWCHNEDYSLSQVWLFFFLYVFFSPAKIWRNSLRNEFECVLFFLFRRLSQKPRRTIWNLSAEIENRLLLPYDIGC